MFHFHPKPTPAQQVVIRLRYPASGESRVMLLMGLAAGKRHKQRLIDCGCGQVLLAYRRGRKVFGASLPTPRLWVGKQPTCEACYKYAANASATMNREGNR